MTAITTAGVCGEYGCTKPTVNGHQYCTALHRAWDEIRLNDRRNDVNQHRSRLAHAEREVHAITTRLVAVTTDTDRPDGEKW